MEQATYAQRKYLRVLLGEEPRDGLTKAEAGQMIYTLKPKKVKKESGKPRPRGFFVGGVKVSEQVFNQGISNEQ